jgi:enediyne biosynthesis protein E4
MKQLHFLLFGLFTANFAHAQQFTALANSVANSTPGDSRGINIVDFNNDGWEDLYITNGPEAGQNNEVYINIGNGQFVALKTDPIVADNSPSDGATCADTDNDGDLDCFMVTWYNKRNYFYENLGDTTFAHIPAAITGAAGTYSETASFADYDKDGLTDIFITNSEGNLRNLLYHNNGNHQYTKITATWLNEAKPSRACVWADFDNDGDQDLYVANENGNTNSLFRNDGTDQFTKITNDPSVQEGQSSMTASWGDVNNDGLLDLFVGNAGYFQAQTNRLFINNGNGGFAAAPTGSILTDAATTYGSAFADYDNDGDLDLFVANGFNNGTILNFLYQNDGAGNFSRNLTALPDFSTPCSFGTAWGDLDNNGFPDLVVSTCKNGASSPMPNNMIWMNNGNTNHWLKVHLVGTTSNKAAIGAQVRIWATINGQSVLQMRDISAQTGYCGQNSLLALFGLGSTTQVDSLQVTWPSGNKQVFYNINTDVRIQIVENNPTIGTTLPAIQSFKAMLLANPIVGEVLKVQLTNARALTQVQMVLVDSNGRSLRTHTLGQVDPGTTTLPFDVAGLAAGIYFLKIETGQGRLTLRVAKG